MKISGTVLFASLYCFGAAEAGFGQLAFIKDNHVFVAQVSSQAASQIDKDDRPKGMLRWDPFRKRLSYLITPEHHELAHLVVLDLSGNQTADLIIRPDVRPLVGLMRYVEDMWWLPNGELRLSGSVGPSNTEQFDLDIATRKESNLRYCYSNTLVSSPDGKHFAAIAPINQFVVEDERVQALSLDDDRYVYTGDSSTESIFILSGPVWAADSQRVAILEKRALSGEAAVTVVNLEGAFTRVPVAVSILDHPSLDWLGDQVIAGQRGVDQIRIDPAAKQVGSVTSDLTDELDRRATAKEAVEAHHRQIDALIKKLGGREGVELTEAPAK